MLRRTANRHERIGNGQRAERGTQTNMEHLESDNVRGEKVGKFCHRLLSASALTLEALSTAATIPFGWMCLSSAPRSHALCVCAYTGSPATLSMLFVDKQSHVMHWFLSHSRAGPCAGMRACAGCGCHASNRSTPAHTHISRSYKVFTSSSHGKHAHKQRFEHVQFKCFVVM